MKQVTVEELEEHLRERLDDVRNGESVQILDGGKAIGTIAPADRGTINVIRHDPALRLQDFRPGAPLQGSRAAEWLIEERERERSGKKHRP
jgi:antitoxin (DNA-binding transcriptional repressor) of toxin-antitoxin stability system